MNDEIMHIEDEGYNVIVTTHNEGIGYLQPLFETLLGSDACRRIIVVDDYSDEKSTVEYLNIIDNDLEAEIFRIKFDGDFSKHKNAANALVKKNEWILQLDGDEYLYPQTLQIFKDLLVLNKDIDSYWIPRYNTVAGITEEHIKKWGWNVESIPGTTRGPAIMWPDYQMRLYKNTPEIKWRGKVHERIVGYKTFAPLPDKIEYAIHHHKDIIRQEKQNALYDSMSGVL